MPRPVAADGAPRVTLGTLGPDVYRCQARARRYDRPVIDEGKPAPDFELTSDSGDTVKLSDLRGKPVVLYFYPKDDTLATY